MYFFEVYDEDSEGWSRVGKNHETEEIARIWLSNIQETYPSSLGFKLRLIRVIEEF